MSSWLPCVSGVSGNKPVPRDALATQPVVLEVEGAHRFAQTGSEGVEVGLGPGLQLAEAVVALGSDEGDPDAGDLPEGQFALPAVPRGEVAIEHVGHVQAS